MSVSDKSLECSGCTRWQSAEFWTWAQASRIEHWLLPLPCTLHGTCRFLTVWWFYYSNNGWVGLFTRPHLLHLILSMGHHPGPQKKRLRQSNTGASRWHRSLMGELQDCYRCQCKLKSFSHWIIVMSFIVTRHSTFWRMGPVFKWTSTDRRNNSSSILTVACAPSLTTCAKIATEPRVKIIILLLLVHFVDGQNGQEMQKKEQNNERN